MRFDKLTDQRREFRRWTTLNREQLLATGLPLVAWSTLEYWDYFLEHGGLPEEVDPWNSRSWNAYTKRMRFGEYAFPSDS